MSMCMVAGFAAAFCRRESKVPTLSSVPASSPTYSIDAHSTPSLSRGTLHAALFVAGKCLAGQMLNGLRTHKTKTALHIEV